MHTNTAVVALTTTQTAIFVAVVVVVIAIAFWVLLSWRPRHRTRQAETAAQVFREDHLGEWAHKRLSTWSTDERHAALRYYTRVGFQARSGAIRTDMVPDNHHATIVALAAQETDGGTSQSKWTEVEWLGRNLAKRRDDLSIKWTPTAKATPEPKADDASPPSAELATAGRASLTSTIESETADKPASEVVGDGDRHQSANDNAADLDIIEIEDPDPDPDPDPGEIDSKSDVLTLAAAMGQPSGNDLDTSSDDDVASAEEADFDASAGFDSPQDHNEDTPEVEIEGVSDQTTDESARDSIDTEDAGDSVTAATTQPESLAAALTRAEIGPDIAASSTSLRPSTPSTDEFDSKSDLPADPQDTSEPEHSESPKPETEAAISESTPPESTAGPTPDDDQTTGRANVPTWILDARAALDSLDVDGVPTSAGDGADSFDASEANDNEQIGLSAVGGEPGETSLAAEDKAAENDLDLANLVTNDDLETDEIALADLDDVELAYLAASTDAAATQADAELQVRMQRLRRRAKRQMRKSADDRAVAVRRAEQGRKNKALEYTKRAAAHEAKAKKFKARRRKLRDIRRGTYTGQ